MIIKLEQGGSAVPFITERIEDDVDSRKKPQWKFIGRTPTDRSAIVFMYPDSATRQLSRHKLDRESVIGRPIEFAKTAQNYIDINLHTNGHAPVAAPAPAPAAAPVTKGKAAQVKQGFSSGPALPGEDGYVPPVAATPPAKPATVAPHATTNGASAAPTVAERNARKQRNLKKFRRAAALHSACLDHVINIEVPKLMECDIGVEPATVSSLVAQLFIRCTDQGLDT